MPPEQDNPFGYDESPQHTGEDAAEQSPCARRGFDPLTLVAGIGTLLVSAYVLSDGASWLPAFDVRWVLAGGAMLIGVLMVAASLRGKRR